MSQIQKQHFDYVIVGAGVLGAPLAAALGQLGTRVCVIERDMSPPDRVVGEVLTDGGVDALLELGLGDCIEGIDAVPVMGQMFHGNGGDNVKFGITHNPYTGENLKGRGFHNGRFVNKLRNCAKAEPNVTIIEATATDFVTEKSSSSDREVVTGVKYSIKNSGGNGVAMASRLVIIADGMFSNFRRKLAILAGQDGSEMKEDTTVASSACRPQFTSVMVSVTVPKMPEHMDEYLHIYYDEPHVMAMYRITPTECRVFFNLNESPSAFTARTGVSLLDHCLKELDGLTGVPEGNKAVIRETLKNQTLRVNQTLYLPPMPIIVPGVVALGDALNIRNPCTGSGMTVALWDVVHLRNILAEHLKVADKVSGGAVSNDEAVSVDRVEADDHSKIVLKELHKRRHNRASNINIGAQITYALYFDPTVTNPALARVRRGFLEMSRMQPEWAMSMFFRMHGHESDGSDMRSVMINGGLLSLYNMTIGAGSIGGAITGLKNWLQSASAYMSLGRRVSSPEAMPVLKD